MTIEELLQNLKDHPNGDYYTPKMAQAEAERLHSLLLARGILSMVTSPFDHTTCRLHVPRPRGH